MRRIWLRATARSASTESGFPDRVGQRAGVAVEHGAFAEQPGPFDSLVHADDRLADPLCRCGRRTPAAGSAADYGRPPGAGVQGTDAAIRAVAWSRMSALVAKFSRA